MHALQMSQPQKQTCGWNLTVGKHPAGATVGGLPSLCPCHLVFLQNHRGRIHFSFKETVGRVQAAQPHLFHHTLFLTPTQEAISLLTDTMLCSLSRLQRRSYLYKFDLLLSKKKNNVAIFYADSATKLHMQISQKQTCEHHPPEHLVDSEMSSFRWSCYRKEVH